MHNYIHVALNFAFFILPCGFPYLYYVFSFSLFGIFLTGLTIFFSPLSFVLFPSIYSKFNLAY